MISRRVDPRTNLLASSYDPLLRRDRDDFLDVACIFGRESLHAREVPDIPDFEDAVDVGGDDLWGVGDDLDAAQTVVVSVEAQNELIHVRIPDERVEVEARRDKEPVLGRVRERTHTLCVPIELLFVFPRVHVPEANRAVHARRGKRF